MFLDDSVTLLPGPHPPVFGAFAGIDIPAGEERFAIHDSFTLPVEVDVLGGGAHAHYLGRELRMTVTLPDGRTEELVHIPDGDFNWQERYYFTDPVRLPAGTRIDVEIVYDNSSGNPSNPSDPPRRVTFGRESTDEMGSMSLEIVPVNEGDLPSYTAAVRQYLQASFFRGVRNLGRGRRSR